MREGATRETTMQVVACTAGGGTRVERRPVPVPAAGEVLLQLLVCGFCGTDLFKLSHATETEGTVLGHELVGRVLQVGDGVSSFAPGDRMVVPHHVACGSCALCRRGSHTLCATFKDNLLAPGGFSEKVLVRERAVARAARLVPEAIGDGEASFLEPAACVLRGIRKAELTAEGCALVIGGGTMGLLHLLVLKAARPRVAVVVCDPVEQRCRVALDLGADVASSPDPEDLAGAVQHASNGLGADAVFDTVGGASPLAAGLAAARPGGTVVLFAHAGEGEVAGFELNAFFKSEQRVVATYSAGVHEQERIAELLFAGVFDPAPLISHRLPLSRLHEAVTLARHRQAYKILLEPDP